MNKFITILIAVILTATSTPFTQTAVAQSNVSQATSETGVVTRIIDGDTIDVQIGNRVQRVRYIGIDSPEVGQCYYAEAKASNEALVLNKTVTLQRDVSNTDRYRRLLRYVSVADGRSVNEVLVQQGMALAKAYRPDVSMQNRLNAAQSSAETSQKGMWGACRIVNGRVTGSLPKATPPASNLPPVTSAIVGNANTTPASVSATNNTCPTGCASPPTGCSIKGNISRRTGERIYHLPGMRYYNNTVVLPRYGERWFCTEQEAKNNGWRKSQK